MPSNLLLTLIEHFKRNATAMVNNTVGVELAVGPNIPPQGISTTVSSQANIDYIAHHADFEWPEDDDLPLK